MKQKSHQKKKEKKDSIDHRYFLAFSVEQWIKFCTPSQHQFKRQCRTVLLSHNVQKLCLLLPIRVS